MYAVLFFWHILHQPIKKQ